MDVVVEIIEKQRYKRGWTIYKLSQEAGLSETAIHRWIGTDTCPSIPALRQICQSFGITMADFFAEGNLVELTPDKKTLIDDYTSLSPVEQTAVKAVIKGYKDNKR